MKYTNNHDLSLPLAIFLAHNDYDGPQGNNRTISATLLMKPIKAIVLAMQNVELQKEVDLSDLVPARMGNALHLWLENAWLSRETLKDACAACGIPEDVIGNIVVNPEMSNNSLIPIFIERRSVKEVDGFAISGKFDMCLDGKLHDLKSCSVWSQIYDSNAMDYTIQGSIYRWLNQDIVTQDVIGIEKLFTDWSATESKRKKDYPKTRVMSKEYPLWSVKETEEWIRTKVAHIARLLDVVQQDELPTCTFEELWEKETLHKVFKTEKSKGAMRVFGSHDEAAAFMEKKGGILKVVPGEVKRCIYCSVVDICDQAKGYIASGKLNL